MNFFEACSTSGSSADDPVASSDPDSSAAGLSLAGVVLAGAELSGAGELAPPLLLLFCPHAANTTVNTITIRSKAVFFISYSSPSNSHLFLLTVHIVEGAHSRNVFVLLTE